MVGRHGFEPWISGPRDRRFTCLSYRPTHHTRGHTRGRWRGFSVRAKTYPLKDGASRRHGPALKSLVLSALGCAENGDVPPAFMGFRGQSGDRGQSNGQTVPSASACISDPRGLRLDILIRRSAARYRQSYTRRRYRGFRRHHSANPSSRRSGLELARHVVGSPSQPSL